MRGMPLALGGSAAATAVGRSPCDPVTHRPGPQAAAWPAPVKLVTLDALGGAFSAIRGVFPFPALQSFLLVTCEA